jgi:hypothetical protein
MMTILGRIYYQTALNEAPKMGTIEYEKSTGISIVYNNTKYDKPSNWISKEFNNAGKSIKYFETPKKTDTPRATFYTPPKKKTFGDFL